MKSTVDRRIRSRKLAVATALAFAAAIGATTAGCAAQADPDAGTGATAHSNSSGTALPISPAATTHAAATATATAASSLSVAAVEDCGQGAALTRPASLVLACADQGMMAKNLKWSSWSGTSATATGIITWHVCTPNCAESTKWDSASAEVTLIDPVSEGGKQVLFTKLELRVTGATPPGFTRVATFNMAPN